MVDDNTMVCTLTVGQLKEALGLAEPDPGPNKKEKLTVPEAHSTGTRWTLPSHLNASAKEK